MLAGVIGPLGLPELIIILVIVVLIFGVGKLTDIGGALGTSIREFRRAAREPDEPAERSEPPAVEAQQTQAPSAVRCTNCGAQIQGDPKFCAQCGAPTHATVE